MSRRSYLRLLGSGGVLVGFVAVTLFCVVAFRFISVPFLIAAWVLYFKFQRTDLRPSLLFLPLALILSFSPIDVLPFPHGEWQPRIVPLVMGYPTPETRERAKRGEVLLGGCIVSGFEPKYYILW